MFHVPAVRSSSGPPCMGRKRTVNHDLPPRMARKGASYYYVCNAPRRWIPLGSDLARAKRLWAEQEAPGPRGATVGDLVQRYIDREDREPNTVTQYRTYQKAIADAFPIPAKQLHSQHVAVWRETQRHRKHYANGCISLLLATCKWGHGMGECEPLTVERWKVAGRDRYLTDDEFRAIRGKAVEWLQIAMDIAYLTASRPSDVLALRWSDVGEVLTLRQKKTGQRMEFRITAEVQSVLDRARGRPVLGLNVIATERGRSITKARLTSAWSAAVGATNFSAQFRDIRSKAATDAKRGGQDFQALLGHTTRKMSERYIKDRTTIVAEPVRKKL